MHNEVIIVTGANQGIGRAIVEKLRSLEFDVLALDINNNTKSVIKCDVTSKSDLKTVAEQISHKSVLAVINNAAIQIEKDILSTTEEDFATTMKTNVGSIYNTTQIFKPFMKIGSAIVNISSVHAKATSSNISAYAASKGAVSALTRAMAIELGPLGIRVNAVCPGAVQTPMLEKGLSRNTNASLAFEKIKASSPINKIGTPSEIADLVCFLIDSQVASNITGQEFYIDSGVTAKLASE